MSDEVDYGAFLDMTDDMLNETGKFEPYMQEIATMAPGEKHRAFLGEFDNGSLIINYSIHTDGLTDSQKDDLINAYEMDLKLKYKEELSNGALFLSHMQGKFDWANYAKEFTYQQIERNEPSYEDLDEYSKHLFEIYNGLETQLKTAEGKTKSDFNANWKTIKQEYHLRMESILKQEKTEARERRKNKEIELKQERKANKLINKLESLIPKKRMFGKNYWYRLDENYVEAIDSISNDLETYVSGVENDDLFSNYNEVFAEYKNKVQVVQSEMKEKMKNKDFKAKLKFNRFKNNWGLKYNQKLMSNKDYESRILEIQDHIQKDIDSINVKTLGGFNYRRKMKEYNDMVKEAEKEVKSEAKQRRKTTEQIIKQEKKAKSSWFKPKIKNGRTPL